MSNDLIPQEESNALDFSDVDETTRERIGSLSAHGLTDLQIADILLLKVEQVAACHASIEFKRKYAAVAEEQIQRQIDLEDGWDAVEEKALSTVLQTLNHTRDPKFALAAAQIANKALRRKNSNGNPIIVDNSKPTTNNIIILQLNKGFVDKSNRDDQKTIDVTPRALDQPKRRSDLPSPKLVEEMLAPVRAQEVLKPKNELEEMFAAAGVVFDGKN